MRFLDISKESIIFAPLFKCYCIEIRLFLICKDKYNYGKNKGKRRKKG